MPNQTALLFAPNAWKPTNTNLTLYPRLQELLREIESCRELTKTAGEPQCMSLEGETGAGKTKLVSIYTDLYPPSETESGAHIPVFYMEIPANATVKSVIQEALERLGDPAAGKGTVPTMNSRLVKFIKALGIELIILDEFHQLIDSETNHILTKVSEWLKMLIKQTEIAFVVVGTNGQVERILRANPQLSRLFAARETLEPFSWGTDEAIAQFSRLVEFSESEIETPIDKTLPRVEVLFRIHYATDGIIANVMNLMRKAAENAYTRNSPTIDLVDLSYAFTKRVGKHLYTKTNPFLTGTDTSFTPPAETLAPKNDAKSKCRGRGKKPPTASQVLTT